jgi:hypothetical protein
VFVEVLELEQPAKIMTNVNIIAVNNLVLRFICIHPLNKFSSFINRYRF